MSTITKDLGAVTAYAYAKEKGYTGTEEEFATLMASYATIAEAAAESAESAQASATTANSAASTATNKASEATTAAQTATAKAEEAQADADAAALNASQALSAASTATSKASEAAQSASDAVTAKTAAQTAQTAAEGSATTAQTAAQTATTKAAEAAESARTLTIDPTLSQSGQAADAKVVGDEIGDLKEDLNDISSDVASINLIDPSTIVDNSVWNWATPVSGSYSRTGLIEVKPNTAYTFANTETAYWNGAYVRARYVTYFDESEAIITPSSENVVNFTTPSNCKYVAITFKLNARNVMLLEGTYPALAQNIVYVPYFKDRIVNSETIDSVSIEKIDGYSVVGKNLFNKDTATLNAYLQVTPAIDNNSKYFVSDYIPVQANESYFISYDALYNTEKAVRSYVLYDTHYQKVSGSNTEVETATITPTVDGYLRFCGRMSLINRTQVENGSVKTYFEPYVKVLNTDALLNDDQVAQVGNILFKKKWAVCGDSFTNSGGTGSVIENGLYKDRPYTYPWIIGNRQNMEIVKFFDGGRTLAFPANPASFANSLTNPKANWYYQNIPEDVDYITIYLGINDEHHATGGGDGEDPTGVIPLGTIDDSDTSTYYGAWNVVLSWLITNRPNAHIGIIVTNGLAIEAYRTAQIEIARKYGIPFIDMNGDDRTPAMLRTVNPNIATSVKQALIAKWAVDPPSNTHPNDAAQLFESAFIENFLKSI